MKAKNRKYRSEKLNTFELMAAWSVFNIWCKRSETEEDHRKTEVSRRFSGETRFSSVKTPEGRLLLL